MTILFLGSLIPPHVQAQSCDITVTDGADLNSAFASVPSNGTICLGNDISINQTYINPDNITFNGNGHTIFAEGWPEYLFFLQSGTLTVSTTIFDGVNGSTQGGGIYISSVSTLFINDSSIIMTAGYTYLFIDDGTVNYCNLNISGGIMSGNGAFNNLCPYTPTPPPTNTPPPAATSTPTPGPCGTTENCLATVVSQNATLIAMMAATATPNPNAFTTTLSSGAVLTIERKSDYGNIFTSGLVIASSGLMGLMAIVGLVTWRR